MIEFSIIDEADQEFGSTLNEQRVSLRLRYNGTSDRWSMDVAIDDVFILYGRRVVTGVDLLLPFRLGIGLIFALPVVGDTDEPNRRNLPDGIVRLYHTTEAELETLLA